MTQPTPRLTAHDFDQELLILFDAYVHGSIDRRGFLEGAKKFAVGGMTAGMFPIVGIPLPLMSYGGSATVMTMASLGLLLNVKRRRLSFF